MEGKITGTGKRIMTMMLSVIMMTGIFAGMKLEVRAAKTYSFDLSDLGGFMSALQNTYYSDDTLFFTGFSQPPAGDSYSYIVRWDYIYNSKRVGSSITTCGENLSNVSITIPNDSQYDYAKLVDYTPPTVSQGPIQVVEFVFHILLSLYSFAAHSDSSFAAHSCSFNGIICRTIPRMQLPVGNNGRTAARYRRLGRV